MQEEVRDLSERLLMLQIEERRVIAEELHDSTAQHLIAADLALERIREVGAVGKGGEGDARFIQAALDDAQQSLQEAKREIRVQTFLLHPPLLQSRGLGVAVENFATGFAGRAGLEIEAHIDRPRIGSPTNSPGAVSGLPGGADQRLPPRPRQQGHITLALSGGELSLTVLDDGIGAGQGDWSTGPRRGVGLSGMRERMERLGGVVSVEAGYPGTKAGRDGADARKRPRRTAGPRMPGPDSFSKQ
jgi:signal transduction histidine kinase